MLGYKPGDPLSVDVVSKVDQMHYYGKRAIDEAVGILGISSSHKILDVGSGFGGPARHLAHTTNCSVTALELQEDIHKEGENLTKRCNLQDRLTHLAGDFLKLDLGAGSFDFIVSWLVFLHISDKKSLFEHCFHSLKPGGKMFIEDFFQKPGVILTDEQIRVYEEDLYMSNLPEKEVYITQLKAAGFTDIQFEDLSEPWTSFVEKRHLEFNQQKERYVMSVCLDKMRSTPWDIFIQ